MRPARAAAALLLVVASATACTGGSTTSPPPPALPRPTVTPRPTHLPTTADHPAASMMCHAAPRATSYSLVLSDRRPLPALMVDIGDPVRVVVRDADADVTAPRAHPGSVLCRARVTPRAHRRTAVFVAVQPGQAYVGATITGVPGGLNHPAYGARITVV